MLGLQWQLRKTGWQGFLSAGEAATAASWEFPCTSSKQAFPLKMAAEPLEALLKFSFCVTKCVTEGCWQCPTVHSSRHNGGGSAGEVGGCQSHPSGSSGADKPVALHSRLWERGNEPQGRWATTPMAAADSMNPNRSSKARNSYFLRRPVCVISANEIRILA